MSWYIWYSPLLWPSIISGIIMLSLSWYSWKRRNIPGALAFSIACIFGIIWMFGATLEGIAASVITKLFWFKFQSMWQIPTLTAITCFILSYAGLGRWLSRRNLVLLAIPPILGVILILTDNQHHLVWQGFEMGQTLTPIRGPVNLAAVGYGLALTLINVSVFIWLFIRSPQHRWAVILILLGQAVGRTTYLGNLVNSHYTMIPLMFLFPFSMYALAMFRFHIFDPVPTARTTAIEQMGEGMLVLDEQGRIVDINPAAEQMLGETATDILGQVADEILPAKSRILTHLDKTGIGFEINLGSGKYVRNYRLHLTPLINQRGQELGQLLLIHEITEEMKAQEQLLEHQQIVSTLQERERLARELHDSIGQVLGYINLQAQSIRKWVQDGNKQKADAMLVSLSKVAQEAHTDIRESILNLKAASAQRWSFLPTLRQYLDNFGNQYGIGTELILAEGLHEDTFDPSSGVHLLRVIQEALTNARKHSHARSVEVAIAQNNNQARITVTDDGCGFDKNEIQGDGQHFGLAFMRERMEQIGGSVKVDSHPGAGTTIKLEAPIRKEQEKIY